MPIATTTTNTEAAAEKQASRHCIWSARIREIFSDTSEWENN